MESGQYYIAYGSNLNVEQMKRRCPDAKMVGSGRLERYALEFRGRKGNAHATITEQEGSAVPVLLWKLSTQDERRLDQYEGAPTYYGKELLTVEIGGERYEAMVYRMQPGYAQNLPSAEYYQTIFEGYQAFGFSEAILRDAVMQAADEVFHRQSQEEEGYGLRQE